MATAFVEVGAGLALIFSPERAGQLVLGVQIASPAATLIRLGGAGLFSVGVACWLARNDGASPAARALLVAITLYNLAAAVVLGWAGAGLHLNGTALWPAFILHVGMSAWCIARLRNDQLKENQKGASVK